MDICLESTEPNSIKSYDDKSITIGSVNYQNSLIVRKDDIQTNWQVKSILELSEESIQPLLITNPEIIIIGHNQLNTIIPMPILAYLSKKRIGIESMSLGAACRTFNVLLNEQRSVVFGVVIPQ